MIGRLTTIVGAVFIAFSSVGQPIPNGGNEKPAVVPGTVVVKLKYSSGNMRTAGRASALETIRESYSVQRVEPVLPPETNGRTAPSQSGLERVYTIFIDHLTDVAKAAEKIGKMEEIEYAEPLYENTLFYVTNDPFANPSGGSQYHLENIKAYEAWDLEKGDTSVVVAVVDTGVELDHADLSSNLFFNHKDPVNGIDDDQDGYVDNYYGWDLSNNDNDPSAHGNGHGNIVAGISSAHSNNGIGIAGVGFNSKFLPVKVMDDASGKLRNEYSGVIYAANHGAKVINLSWGSAWGYSKFAQDVINYAVLDKDVVVIAAAGNTHDHIDFYPASFDNVLSVTASDGSDNFAGWATYSYHVDLMAPGQSIFSTKLEGSYGSSGNGTSFAAPMVAGAAALVRSKYPDLDARQVMEQLRVSADDVSHIGENDGFAGKIGKGRLNIYRALADTLSPSVRLKSFTYSGSYGEHVFPGDTIRISPVFTNYLRKTGNLSVTLSSGDSQSVYSEKNYLISSLDTYETKGIETDPWEVVLSDNVPPGARVYFRIDYTTEGYADFEYFYIDITPHYFDIAINNLSMTVSSDGDLGYDRDSYNWGKGIWLGLERISNFMGLILSRNTDYAADNVVSDYSILVKGKDFVPTAYARMHNNSVAELDVRSVFTESDQVVKQGLKIEQKILGWNEREDDNFFILEYRLINESDSTIDKLNTAFFADYDLKDKNANASGFDPETGLSYIYDKTNAALFAGISLLSAGESTAHSFDLSNLEGNAADLDTYFPDSLKYKYSTGNFEKTEAGVYGLGNNVANLIGLKNLALLPGESKKVAFVMMAGPSLDDLQAQLVRAKTKYQEYLDNPPLDYLVHVCQGDAATLQPKTGASFEIYETAALTARIDSASVFEVPSVDQDTAFYIVEILDGIRQDVRTASIMLKNPLAAFSPAADTLFISGETLDTIRFFNNTLNSDSFDWDFGNGYYSKVAEPLVRYNEPGIYTVKLKATSSLGCADSAFDELVVVRRSEKPQVGDIVVCKGEQAKISASNSSEIRVYANKELTDILYEGVEYTSDALSESGSYFVTNVEGYESLPVKVSVKVSHPVADLSHSIEYQENKLLLRFKNNSSNAENLQWKINGEIFSEEEVYYDFSDTSNIEIALEVYDSLMCRDLKSLSLKPAKSPKPETEDISVCKKGTATVNPAGGSNFLFYADAQRTNVLGFGESFEIGPLSRDTVLFVSSIDSLRESDTDTVSITISDFRARLSIRTDSIDLAEENTVEISNTSIGYVSSWFLLPTGAIDTAKNISRTFTEPGTYTFTVIARSSDNCVDTASASLHAFRITSAEALWESVPADVKLYPNPAQNHVNIHFNSEYFQSVDIVDQAGRTIFSTDAPYTTLNDLEIDTSHLSNGIYLVRLHRENDLRVFKLAINR